MKRLSIAAIMCFSLLGIWLALKPPEAASAQSGYRGGSSTREGSNSRRGFQKTRPFEDRFWNYLISQKYENWAPVPGKSDGFSKGESPHGAFLKMYLNRTAAGNPKQLPNGSILVKENYGPDQKTLMAVTVMYRSNGYNPNGGDWYWAKYNPDGTIARKGSVKLAGKVQGCIACHGESAEGNDFAFFNDGT
ncbi:cytochrome P460 family protein [Gimesia aquarii]|uniref:Cytochrome P460 domain-containing protein n=1 Tax=Gimesia aquarii TaxID=2527964 RepID=A0A517VQA4_9PLAN|nr:cytochrome P460 family protein [Gimesia aquarii]QDT95129.1 hypothetical protein V144x_05680 [Gimesia aquarii]